MLRRHNMVEVPTEYILVFFSVVFVPLFIFLMKMIMEQNKTVSRLDTYDEHLKETKGHHTTIELIRQRLETLEGDVKELFRRIRNYNNDRYGDRDGSYFPDGDIANHGTG